MNDDAPTMGELMRVVVDIRQQLTDMRQQNAEREKLFVRVDVFEARQATDATLMRGLENEVHSVQKRLDAADDKVEKKVKEAHSRIDAAEERARATRVLLWTSLAAPLLVALILAAVLTRGGA